MSEFTSYIELAGKEIVVMVTGDYQPEESQTYNYPGCAESAEIGAVEAINGGYKIDLLPLLDKTAIEFFEEQLIEHESKQFHATKFNHRFQSIAQEERVNAMRASVLQRGRKI